MKNLRTLLLMLAGVTILVAVQVVPSAARKTSLGVFEAQTDVGKVNLAGSAIYNAKEQSYTVEGSGSNMWFDHDEFHFVWQRMKGDFLLTARVEFLGKGVEPHRKIGWIVRSSLDPDSTMVDAVVHGDGLTSLQYRRTKGAQTEETRLPITGADVLRLERKGETYTMSAARFGDPFTTARIADLNLGDEVYVGLFVCSHNKDVSEKAIFRNVRITVPAKDSFVPYRDYIGSDLEVMDVATGYRKVLYRVSDSLQAPNWTRDGKSLIYNRNGRLYRFDLVRKTSSLIDTGTATNNNNDHVISFNGKTLVISNQSRETGNQSNVYTVRIRGGKARRITAQGPSYAHGWSPDGKFIVFTGERNGDFDIYRIPAKGGAEQRLTTAKGLDDGPEYTPDGKYIYFNSVRSGTMQIWRMKSDGSDPEQVTKDEYNDWFPHISPNGKWIVFISFPKDVSPSDHPFYKRVYLQLMPIEGGKPKVIAYVYGGQGTINVPSWSPDSRKIAFVSNTDVTAH